MRTGGLNADPASVGTLARVRRPVRVFTASVLVLSVGCGGHAKEAKVRPSTARRVKCRTLTFDDGPGPFTDRLLGILKNADAEATFFMIGNKVADNPGGRNASPTPVMEIGSHVGTPI